MTKLDALLGRLGACKDARVWARDYPSLPEAWEACQRGDWMLWLAGKGKLCSRKGLVLAACECARLALPHVPEGENRPRVAIETAERWARGEATIAEVRTAANAANAAYAYAAANAAYAYAAANAAAYAYIAANAYAAAANAAAAGRSARAGVLRRCADIVRRRALEGKWKRVNAKGGR